MILLNGLSRSIKIGGERKEVRKEGRRLEYTLSFACVYTSNSYPHAHINLAICVFARMQTCNCLPVDDICMWLYCIIFFYIFILLFKYEHTYLTLNYSPVSGAHVPMYTT